MNDRHGKSASDDGPLDFRAVLEDEFRTNFPEKPLEKGLDRYRLRRQFFDSKASALCLSGGGMRSASFCLGVVQGLAKRRAVRHFTYLSTVSGGGYTGSMLSAWAYRAKGGIDEVESKLKTGPDRDSPVTRLRGYTNYLAPRKGVRSPDFWTLIATYARNLLLNWLILFPLLGLFISVPYLIVAAFHAIRDNFRDELGYFSHVSFYFGFALLIFGVWLLRRRTSLAGLRDAPPKDERETAPADLSVEPSTPQKQRDQSEYLLEESSAPKIGARTWALWPCYALGVLAITASWYWHSGIKDHDWFGARGAARALFLPEKWSETVLLPLSAGLLSFILGIAFYAAWQWRQRKDAPLVGPRKSRLDWLALAVAFAMTGAIMGAFIVGWSAIWGKLSSDHEIRRFIVLGPPLLLILVVLSEILFQGLASKLSDDYDREWWSQVCARLLMASVVWTAWFGTALYGPLVLEKKVLDALKPPDINQIIAVLTVFGAILARIGFTRGPIQTQTDKPPVLANLGDIVFKAACWIFVIVFFALIAAFVYWALGLTFEWLNSRPPERGLKRIEGANTLLLAGTLAVALGVACFSVNINKFSLHAMYRERLIRAFLGISRARHVPPAAQKLNRTYNEDAQFQARRPNHYTDFDRDDNPVLAWLDSNRTLRESGYTRPPFHVINCALNLVGGRNLAWQERKASSFTLSALHTGGSEMYRKSAQYCSDAGGLTLGTALTMSGAAIAPNAGFYSSALNTFILTLFNARLGWWLGHPRKPKLVRKVAPAFALWPMLKELTGRTHGDGNWIYLSDGGHFDNLGLYEMVRRAVRYIVVVDASADADRKLDAFGNALRKIRIDFGIHIERRRDAPWRIGRVDQGPRGRYCALFDIDYTPWLGNGAAGQDGAAGKVLGRLLYIKPSYYEHENSDVPIDVIQYSGTSVNFPHQSTMEQFYDESQFESYRALGEHQILSIFGDYEEADAASDVFTMAALHIRKRYTSSDPTVAIETAADGRRASTV